MSEKKETPKKATASKSTTASKAKAPAKKTTTKAKETTAAKKAPAKATKEKEVEKVTKVTAKKAETPEVEKKAAVKEVAVEEKPVAAEKATEEKEVTATKKAATPKKASKPKEIKPLEDFDWNALGKRNEIYSEDEAKKMEEMYGETLSVISNQDVIEGEIVSISPREVVVNIGYKSDGVISRSELRYNKEAKAGDRIQVFIENQEDKNGQLVLSHTKARALWAWDRVNEALGTQEIISGYVKCRTKGGLIADVFGIEAFLPGSQIDVKPIRDYDLYVGRTMDFKVVKINKEYKNVVVSHKALIEAELEEQKKAIISKLEKGQVLEGIVKNITSYGVFIDLGGVDGLIHITDLSWGRINHPEEIVQLDQKLNVVILDFDDDKKRIALGLKQLQKHPWDSLDENLKVGDKVEGKVVVVADYGAFIEIQPGVEGLIHVSEITWSNHLKPAQDFFKVNDTVEAVILTLDKEDRKMSLGVKQLTPDPWEKIEEKYPIESKNKGKVTNISDFGVFVELESGVDGLIHISDLSWSKKVNHPSEITNVGDEIETVILEIDRDNRRLSLGYKQLEENPWDVFETVFTIGSVHNGTITEINKKGIAIVSLPYGVEGIANEKNILKEDGATAKVDEALDFKVTDFNKHTKRIMVSHTQLFKDAKGAEDEKKKTAAKSKAKSDSKAVKKINENQEKTTLGDLSVLENLKAEMDKKK